MKGTKHLSDCLFGKRNVHEGKNAGITYFAKADLAMDVTFLRI